MNEITPQMVRDKCAELNIIHRTIWEACGLNKSWFLKMIMVNPKYAFVRPNPAWMRKVWGYLLAHEEFYAGMDKKFLKHWKGSRK